MITKIDYDRLNHVHAIYLDNGKVLHDIIKADSPVTISDIPVNYYLEHHSS